MTVGCARCHDHKIDPISTRDYYSLLAFFHDITPNNRGPLADIGTPKQQAVRDKRLAEKRLAEQEAQDKLFEIQEIIKIELAQHIAEAIFPDLPTSPMRELTYRFYRDTFEQFPADFALFEPTAEGRLFSNLFSLAPASRKKDIGLVFEGTLQVPEDTTYTFHINLQGACRLIINGYKVAELIGARDIEVALTHGDVPIRLEYFNKDVDKPQLEVSWSGTNFEKQPLSTNATINFNELLKTHAELIETNESLKALVDQQKELKKQRDQRRRQRVPYEHQALAVSEREQTPTHILRRGNPHLVGREVKPAFPKVLNPSTVDVPPVLEGAKSSGKRRIFAEWVASAKNPLTARVIVNRILATPLRTRDCSINQRFRTTRHTADASRTSRLARV